jgi:hypothetical protein
LGPYARSQVEPAALQEPMLPISFGLRTSLRLCPRRRRCMEVIAALALQVPAASGLVATVVHVPTGAETRW